MKKVLFLAFVSILFASNSSAQLEGCYAVKTTLVQPEKDIFHFSFGYTEHHIALTSIMTRMVSKKLAVFVGFNIAPSTGREQTEKVSPYRSIYDSYKGGFIGLAICPSNTFTIGLAGEIQETTKKYAVPGGYEDIIRFCPRIYMQGKIGNSSLLVTSNMFGRLFDCWGYWTVPFNPKAEIGIYANTSCMGIGPMIKWGFKKSRIRPFGLAIGYNPTSNEYGATIMAQNF
jgi:hypothetical protein